METLKAEIFDLIVAQDKLKIQYAEIERRKQGLLKKLQETQNAELDSRAKS